MTDADIPTPDADALAWLQIFALGISNGPATYRLTAADAVTIGNSVAAFAEALGKTQNRATVTLANLAAKDAARASAEQVCRRFATLVTDNEDISDADKIAIGVPPLIVGI